MREWIHGWVRRSWQRKTGPVENAELWKRLASESARHQVDWRWVRGHAGHPHNEYSNHLATRAAREQDASGGPIASGFEAWLQDQREKYERYFDFNEWAGPADERFDPAPAAARTSR
jgi:ribonuclease HI